jgi:S-adenosylmethionine uptake transporter
LGDNLKGTLAALAAFAIFATHDVFVKMLGGSFTPFQIIFFSTLLSFPLVIIGLMREQTSGHLRPVHPWWMSLRTLCTVVTGSSAFYAFSVLPLAQVYAILFASPLLITVLSIPILGEKVGLHRWGAVIAGLIGVMIVLQPGATDLTLGHLAALTAALGSATASVVVRKIGREERSAALLLYPMIANFLLMAAVMPFVYVPPQLIDLGLFAAISVLGLAASLLVILAYRLADAAIVAPMQYSQILWAALFGALLFSERPELNTWAGAAVIIASGLYIVAREARAGVSRNTPVSITKGRPEIGTTPRITALKGLPGRVSLGLQNRP